VLTERVEAGNKMLVRSFRFTLKSLRDFFPKGTKIWNPAHAHFQMHADFILV